jgi:hypothetical protein
MEEGKRVYDDGYNMIVDWEVNTEKLTEVGVLLPHAPVSER